VPTDSQRPTLIFDGDCGFCRMWVDFWRSLTGDRVDYLPYQKAGGRFPAILVEDFRRAVHYVNPEARFSGAQAVAQLLSRVSGYQ